MQTTSTHAASLAIQLRYEDNIDFLEQTYRALQASLIGNDRHRVVGEDERPQIVITVGPKALQSALAQKLRVPILAVAVARPMFTSLLEARGMTLDTTRDVVAIFVGQSPQHNLALVRALLPKVTSIGGYETSMLPVRPAFLVAAKELSLTVVSERANSPEHALSVLDGLLARSDALLITQNPDATNNRNIRQIVHAALLAGKPIIGGASDGFVAEGALAAIYSSPQEMAAEAMRRLETWRTSRTLGTTGYAREWTLRVNRTTASTLRINLPGDAELRAAIKRLVGEE